MFIIYGSHHNGKHIYIGRHYYYYYTSQDPSAPASAHDLFYTDGIDWIRVWEQHLMCDRLSHVLIKRLDVDSI